LVRLENLNTVIAILTQCLFSSKHHVKVEQTIETINNKIQRENINTYVTLLITNMIIAKPEIAMC